MSREPLAPHPERPAEADTAVGIWIIVVREGVVQQVIPAPDAAAIGTVLESVGARAQIYRAGGDQPPPPAGTTVDPQSQGWTLVEHVPLATPGDRA